MKKIFLLLKNLEIILPIFVIIGYQARIAAGILAIFCLITAFLFQLGFESCEEAKNNIYAYASEDNVTDDLINEIEILSKNLNFKFTFNEIITENWNKNWESNFKPIQINNECIIRASFHKQIKLKYEIVIDPKMSFGTDFKLYDAISVSITF